MKHKDLKIASLEYRKKNEKRAICDYINKYNKNVQIVGLFVNPLQPWLCTSVDGIVIDTNNLKILENVLHLVVINQFLMQQKIHLMYLIYT